MKVLVTGASGMLATAVVPALERRGHAAVALTRAELDVRNAARVATVVRGHAPDAVIQCAAYTRVDDAESEPDAAMAVNAEGAANVARACSTVGARFLYPSTDYVFDGTARSPYRPDAEPSPLGAYGRSKLGGEEAAREADDWLVVRTAWLYGAGGRHFVGTIVERARAGTALRVVDDQRGSPTWTADLAGTLVELLESASPGIYHATNAGETTWYGLAREVLDLAGIDTPLEPTSTEAFPRPAPRPRYSVLDCESTASLVGALRDWRGALAAALEEGV